MATGVYCDGATVVAPLYPASIILYPPHMYPCIHFQLICTLMYASMYPLYINLYPLFINLYPLSCIQYYVSNSTLLYLLSSIHSHIAMYPFSISLYPPLSYSNYSVSTHMYPLFCNPSHFIHLFCFCAKTSNFYLSRTI